MGGFKETFEAMGLMDQRILQTTQYMVHDTSECMAEDSAIYTTVVPLIIVALC